MSTGLVELETAAQVILGPPNLVSTEQRQAAEKIFLEFRETKTPYILCRQILETSRIDFVLFETADLLKRAIIREWSLLQESDILSLRQYLLQYVIQKQVPSFVRDRILQVIAIIIKRNSVDDFGAERSKILGEVENLIINGDFPKQVMSLSLIAILMQEYATTVKSTDVGLPWEVHLKAKKLFEQTDLRRVFQFCVRVISEIIKSDPPYPENTSVVLKHLLAIVEKILTWGFIRRFYHIRMIGLFEKLYESDLAPSLKLNAPWREIILDTQVLPLMFSIYWKVRNHEELAHHALSNLVQFASLNGEIFNQKDSKLHVEYLHKYIEGFLNLIQSISFVGRECLGISRIVLNLVSFFPSVVMSQLPENLLKSFLENITLITCRFAEASTKDEPGSEDEKYHLDALDTMLDSCVYLFQNKDFLPKDIMKQCAIQMFNVYLQCHLAPPHGSRIRTEVEGEEIEETEDNDRIKFKDQMQIIGVFGRNALDHSLILLCRLLEEKTQQLSAHLQRMQSQAMTINDSNALDNVFEDIHWLVLITGHVLCIDYEGEIPQAPKEIMEYSVAALKAGHSNVEATLKAFASIQQCTAETDANIEQVDKAIRLTISVLKLCTMQSMAAEAKLGHFISPEVGCTLMWFLKRWSTSYYLMPEEYYVQLSQHFLICFGTDTEGAEFVARFILTKIYSNIFHFHSEPILLQDTVDVFISLVEISRKKKSCIVKSDEFWPLVDLQSKIKPGAVPQSVKCGLLKGFVIAGATIPDENSRKEYWQRILTPIQSRFKSIICRENFNRIYQEEQVKSEIVDLLESFTGIASGASISTLDELFSFMSTVLSELPSLLNLYHNYEIIVQLILKLFNECAKQMLINLSSEDTKRMYEYCLSVVQVYARCNANRFTTEVIAEEDNCQDLMLVMKLLTELLTKDCVNFSESGTIPIAAADIVLYGIDFILPLMTLDLLKYPSLCKHYYKMITFVTEIHPQKVCSLREELLKQLIMSIQLGFVQFSSDVLVCCLDFVESLAKYIAEKKLQNSSVSQMVMPLLKELFDLILSHQINGDMISSASTSLYSLICCYPEQYKLYVRNLIQSQSDPIVAERLESAFTDLTPNVCSAPEAAAGPVQFGRRLQFRENFDKFITSVHSFLLIK